MCLSIPPPAVVAAYNESGSRGTPLSDMSTQDQIDKCEKDIKRYTDLGRAADAERFEDKLLELRRKLKKEEKEIKPHPS